MRKDILLGGFIVLILMGGAMGFGFIDDFFNLSPEDESFDGVKVLVSTDRTDYVIGEPVLLSSAQSPSEYSSPSFSISDLYDRMPPEYDYSDKSIQPDYETSNKVDGLVPSVQKINEKYGVELQGSITSYAKDSKKGDVEDISVFSVGSMEGTQINIERFIEEHTELAIDYDGKISSILFSGDGFVSEGGAVRVVAVDNNNEEYLIFGSDYMMLEDKFEVNGVCEETCNYQGDGIKFVYVMVRGGDLNFDSLYFVEGDFVGLDSRENYKLRQEEYRVNKLNEKIIEKGLVGEVSNRMVSDRSYHDLRMMWGGGFEFYQGIEFPLLLFYPSPDGEKSVLQSDQLGIGLSATYDFGTSNFPRDFSWRDRHGQDFLTSVKNQGDRGACWAFAEVSSGEAVANLYFNDHKNYDFSEEFQYSYKCFDYATTRDFFIPDSCLEYLGVEIRPCSDVLSSTCFDYLNRKYSFSETRSEIYSATIIGEVGGMNLRRLNVDTLKEHIILEGPLSAAISMATFCDVRGHQMSLYGWETDSSGKIWWLYKNSWGPADYPYWKDSEFPDVKTWAVQYPVSVSQLEGGTPEIICEDRDHDGFCNWGISETIPESCSTLYCKEDRDCDDSNANLGPYDESYNCIDLHQKAEILNLGSSANGNLILKVQKLSGEDWIDEATVYNDAINVPSSENLDLVSYWNSQGWSASSLGNYRVFAEVSFGGDSEFTTYNFEIVEGCGDGIIQDGEECDCGLDGICTPSELGGETCNSQGCISGTISCFERDSENACKLSKEECNVKCFAGDLGNGDGTCQRKAPARSGQLYYSYDTYHGGYPGWSYLVNYDYFDFDPYMKYTNSYMDPRFLLYNTFFHNDLLNLRRGALAFDIRNLKGENVFLDFAKVHLKGKTMTVAEVGSYLTVTDFEHAQQMPYVFVEDYGSFGNEIIDPSDRIFPLDVVGAEFDETIPLDVDWVKSQEIDGWISMGVQSNRDYENDGSLPLLDVLVYFSGNEDESKRPYLDLTYTRVVCGDGYLHESELCDVGSVGASCEDFGFSGGTLGCNFESNCMEYDFSECITKCGNMEYHQFDGTCHAVIETEPEYDKVLVVYSENENQTEVWADIVGRQNADYFMDGVMGFVLSVTAERWHDWSDVPREMLISRIVLPFDTNEIPENAQLISSELLITSQDSKTGLSIPNEEIYTRVVSVDMENAPNVELSDFGNFGDDEIGRIYSADCDVWMDCPDYVAEMDSSGSWINREAWTTLGLRIMSDGEYNEDFVDGLYMNFAGAEGAGEVTYENNLLYEIRRPTLILNYTVP